MKIELLPSTIEDGKASDKQHLSCFVVNDVIAIDAGSLSLAANKLQKQQIRDVVLSHAHIDHIAGLPLYVDDLFSELKTPVRIHAAEEVIEVLREHVFNWKVYPDFAELENDFGPVLEYHCFKPMEWFEVAGINIKPIPVNHKVPSYGFIIKSGDVSVGLTGDTAEMNVFWSELNAEENLSALLVECAFPDNLIELAKVSHHLTPNRLGKELELFTVSDCTVYVINIKPVFRDATVKELKSLGIDNLEIFRVGRSYEF